MRKTGLLIAGLVAVAPSIAGAHQLNVFASVDCKAVLVEAKFSNGKRPVKGEVRIFDGARQLLTIMDVDKNGMAMVPLDKVDHKSGLVVEVHTGGGHDDYWILTPDDIAQGCTE